MEEGGNNGKNGVIGGIRDLTTFRGGKIIAVHPRSRYPVTLRRWAYTKWAKKAAPYF